MTWEYEWEISNKKTTENEIEQKIRPSKNESQIVLKFNKNI